MKNECIDTLKTDLVLFPIHGCEICTVVLIIVVCYVRSAIRLPNLSCVILVSIIVVCYLRTTIRLPNLSCSNNYPQENHNRIFIFI